MTHFNNYLENKVILINLNVDTIEDAHNILRMYDMLDIVIFSHTISLHKDEMYIVLEDDFIEFLQDEDDLVYIVDDIEYKVTHKTRLLNYLTPYQMIYLKYTGEKPQKEINVLRGLVRYDLYKNMLKMHIIDRDNEYVYGSILHLNCKA